MNSTEFITQLEALIEQRIHGLIDQNLGPKGVTTDLQDNLILIQRAFPKLIDLLISTQLHSEPERLPEKQKALSRYIFNSLKIMAVEYIDLSQSSDLNAALKELNRELLDQNEE